MDEKIKCHLFLSYIIREYVNLEIGKCGKRGIKSVVKNLEELIL